MYSLMVETLNEHSFESQGLSLSDAQEVLNQGSSSKVGGFLKMLDKLLELNHVDLLILQAVLEFSPQENSLGIDSKTIGAKVHLSRYAVLQRAKKLAQKGLLVQASGSRPKSGAKPTYYFLPSSNLTLQAVSTALEEAVENLPLPPNLESSTKDMSEAQDYVSVLSKLDVKSLQILRVVGELSSQGARAREIEKQSELSSQATNARLRDLVERGLLTRQERQLSASSKGFVYFLIPNLTLSQIDSILQAENPLGLNFSHMNGTRVNAVLFDGAGTAKAASQQKIQLEASKEKVVGAASLDKKLQTIWEMLDRAFHEIANLRTEMEQIKQNYQSVESFDPDPEQLLKVLSKNERDAN